MHHHIWQHDYYLKETQKIISFNEDVEKLEFLCGNEK
jgi:hypothetical protein